VASSGPEDLEEPAHVGRAPRWRLALRPNPETHHEGRRVIDSGTPADRSSSGRTGSVRAADEARSATGSDAPRAVRGRVHRLRGVHSPRKGGKYPAAHAGSTWRSLGERSAGLGASRAPPGDLP